MPSVNLSSSDLSSVYQSARCSLQAAVLTLRSLQSERESLHNKERKSEVLRRKLAAAAVKSL